MRKVFVTVGTHPQNFTRLLKEIDSIASESEDTEFFAQTGYTDYKPENFLSKNFFSTEEYTERFASADVIVSHAGAGTIINALRLQKPLVLVPRLKKFSEHTNDHQLDLARALEKRRKAIVVEDILFLKKAIEKAFSFKPNISSDREKLVSFLKNYLLSLEK